MSTSHTAPSTARQAWWPRSRLWGDTSRRTPSAAEVDCGHLAALVAQLPTAHQPHGPILCLLRTRQRGASGTANGRSQPAGQFLVARLGIGMSQAVELVQSCTGGLPFVDLELLDMGLSLIRTDRRCTAYLHHCYWSI